MAQDDEVAPLRSAPADEERRAWREVFEAQKSVIEFLRETLMQIKRDNRHYNFGTKLVRIVDGALNKTGGEPRGKATSNPAAGDR